VPTHPDAEGDSPHQLLYTHNLIHNLLLLIQPSATLVLQVTYPDAYPDKPPLLDLSNPPNAPRYPHLDIQEDKSRLLEALQPVIEENLGMAMVFTLVSTVKDSAELLISERQQAVQALKEVEAARAEEEENRKFHGTAVTRESFLAWRERFRGEMEQEEQRAREEKELEDRKKRGAKEESKMSGRELWEKGLVGRVEEDDESEDALGVELERLKVDDTKVS
jgi:valyl-tRNA synthetase